MLCRLEHGVQLLQLRLRILNLPFKYTLLLNKTTRYILFAFLLLLDSALQRPHSQMLLLGALSQGLDRKERPNGLRMLNIGGVLGHKTRLELPDAFVHRVDVKRQRI